MNKKLIYLDNNATTPADPRVVVAMLPYFHEIPGNAASRHHAYGWKAEEAVTVSREKIAALINADPKEIVFTSGATESDNLALKGVFETYHRKGAHIVTLKTEHKAVLDTCKRLEKIGGEVTYLDVQADGLVDLNQLEASIRPDTVLVTIMWANNETGVIQPMEAIGKICEKKGVLLMSDATQAVGKIPVDPSATGVHLMAFSAHKMYGPKGIGALYVSNRQPKVKLTQQIEGGGHERGIRSGTLNVPAIVGFGRAAEIARSEMNADAHRLSQWRDKLQQALLTKIEETYINGDQAKRMPHVTNLAFRFTEGEGIMMALKNDVALSSGSACTSASLDPSHVLTAMGLSNEMAHSSLRFSLGRFNKEEEINRTIEAVIKAVEHLRAISPVWELFKDGVEL